MFPIFKSQAYTALAPAFANATTSDRPMPLGDPAPVTMPTCPLSDSAAISIAFNSAFAGLELSFVLGNFVM